MADFPTAAQSAVLAANSAKGAANSASISAANAQKAAVAANNAAVSAGSIGSVVRTIVPGTNVTVDATDPLHPIVSASGGGGGSGDSIKITGVAGSDIVAPFLAVNTTDGGVTWNGGQGPDSTTSINGIATTEATSGQPVTVVVAGLLTNVLSGVFGGSPVWLGDNGAVSDQKPTDDGAILIRLGTSINSTDMIVCIENYGYSGGATKGPITTQLDGKLNPNILPLTPVIGSPLTDADTSINISEGSQRILPEGTLTADRVLTLDVSGSPITGESICIVRLDTVPQTYTINDDASTTLVVLPSTSIRYTAYFKFDGTHYVLDHAMRINS